MRRASSVAQSSLGLSVPVDAFFRVVGAVAHEVGSVTPGLGRNAAAPQAFAAGQRGVVDHRHLDAMLDQVACAVFAAGTAADDDDLRKSQSPSGNRCGGDRLPVIQLSGFSMIFLQIGQVGGDVRAVHHTMIAGDVHRHAVRVR